MKQQFYKCIYNKTFFAIVFWLFVVNFSYAQTFPTATQVAKEMTIGWNIGNTMEALYLDNNTGQIVAGETAWNNKKITQVLIDSVKAAGFNTIRIPIAWDVHANNSVIDATWIARVKEVVDYCYKDNLYVIINIHWDKGWLEENCTTAMQTSVKAKQKTYWTQIANYFKAYDHHLLFASANEPAVSDATGMSVLLSYHQTFVDAVRNTGGNNTQRILIVQGPTTDIEKTNTLMNNMPTDPSAGRMMAEVHFYPYQFTLMDADASWGNQFFYWGACNHSTSDASHNPTWGEEAWVDEMFQLMKVKFVDKGYPVVLGEFGAKNRTTLTGANYTLHKQSREYFLKYVVKSALNHGLIPIYWCAGLGDLFDRTSGAVLEKGTVNALMAGAYTTLTTVNCGNNDCKNVAKGHAYTNPCNKCVLGYDASCYAATDCNGTTGGTATKDNCDRCIGGTTGKTACSSVAEAETVACSKDGTVDNNNAGFKGAGFINVSNAIGSTVTFSISATNAGSATISFRYANGGAVDRPAQINLNGTVLANSLSFPVTGTFTDWKTADITLTLVKGMNTVKLISTTAEGLSNIDQIGYVSAGLTTGNCVITGIDQFSTNSGITAFPNPFSDRLTIIQNGQFNYQILNLDGMQIETGNATDKIEIGSEWQPGFYFIKTQGTEGTKTFKISKTNH
jgi:aryl-phospho-beta-D-glucosidase BglC (GH1 family)